MKILVLSDKALKEEMLSRPQGSQVEYDWVEQPGELADFPDADAVIDLQFRPERERIELLAGRLPKPVLVNSVTFELAVIHPRFIRFNGWPTFLQRRVWEISVVDTEAKSRAERLFTELGWEWRFVPDLCGMIAPRIVSAIINEAYFALGTGVSGKDEIDKAMRLGTNYPYGPFEWSGKIGLERIYELLNRLAGKDKRYEIAPCMREELGYR